MNRIASVLAIVGFSAMGAAAQSGQPAQQGTAPKAGETVTITGCLASGNNNMYTLTAAPAAMSEAPTGTTATTPAGTKVTKTVTYNLTGGKPEELKAHVGHTIAVTGTEAAPQMTAAVKDESKTAANAQGTSKSTGTSGAKPNVETTAQAQIVVRQLSVNTVKMVSANCSLTK